VDPESVRFRHAARMQYYGQLNDLEIVSPHAEIEDEAALDDLLAAFEEAYGRLYARSARSPELGYVITQAIVHGTAPVSKPALPDRPEGSESPPAGASKGARTVRWAKDEATTEILQLEALEPGNVVAGPAIVESEATTLAVPPGRRARLDGHLVFHFSSDGRQPGSPT